EAAGAAKAGRPRRAVWIDACLRAQALREAALAACGELVFSLATLRPTSLALRLVGERLFGGDPWRRGWAGHRAESSGRPRLEQLCPCGCRSCAQMLRSTPLVDSSRR